MHDLISEYQQYQDAAVEGKLKFAYFVSCIRTFLDNVEEEA